LIYEAFLKQYRIPEIDSKNETPEDKQKREHKLKSLNALCVRIVFCLYADYTEVETMPKLFIKPNSHKYLCMKFSAWYTFQPTGRQCYR
ncbi:MAG: hypothetical protein PUA54_04775, partial [Coprococcus catus]|nr:hypothetical protein [Coprococcus catus]